MLARDAAMEDIPRRFAWMPGWHTHPELCFTDGFTFGGITDPNFPTCPAGTGQGVTQPMTHAWIVGNECHHRFASIGVSGLHCEEHHP
jgi:hypothetical protein